MSMEVDNRIVKLEFNNKQFEENVKTSLNSLQKLKEATEFKGGTKGLENLTKATKSFSLDGIASGIEALQNRFSTLGIIGMTVLQNITNSAINAGKKVISVVTDSVVQGGIRRAMNLEKANFQLRGLLNDDAAAVKAIMDNVNEAVTGTAYGLDEAAVVASQLAASGMRGGQQMESTLKGIAGVAALTSSSYSDIGNIFTQVAGNGRLMGDQLLQLSSRGMNAAATIKDFWNGVNDGSIEATDEVKAYIKSVNSATNLTEQDIRDMVSKGKINFKVFSEAMNNAFGEHATKANETFSGSLSNVKAALARIGAKFATPGLTDLRDIFNALRPAINAFNDALQPFVDFTIGKMEAATKKVVSFFNALVDGKKIESTFEILTAWAPYIYKHLTGAFTNLETIVRTVFAIFQRAAKNVFPSLDLSLSNILNILNRVSTGFQKLTEKLKPKNGENLKNLKNIFEGFFSVLKIGKGILTAAVSGIGRFLSRFTPLKDSLLGLGGDIGNLITRFADFAEGTNLFTRAFEFIDSKVGPVIDFLVKGITKVVEAIRDFINTDTSGLDTFGEKLKARFEPILNLFEGIKNIFLALAPIAKAIINVVGDVLKMIGDGLQELTSKLGDSSISNVGKVGLFAGIFVLIEKFKEFNVVRRILDGLSGTLTSIGGMLRSFIDDLSANLQKNRVGLIKSYAEAMLMLAGALFIIALIPEDKLSGAIGALTILLGEMVALMSIMNNALGSGKTTWQNLPNKLGIMALATSMIAIAGAVVLLALAAKMLSSLDLKSLAKGLGGVSYLLGAVVAFMYAINELNLSGVKAPKGLLKLAVVLLVLAGVVKILGSMDIKTLVKGLGSVGILIFMLTGFLVVLNNPAINNVKVPKGLISIAIALLLLSVVVKKLGEVDPEKLAAGLISVIVLLGSVAAFLTYLNQMKVNNAMGIGAGLLLVAAGIAVLSLAVSKFASMSPEALGQGLMAVAASLFFIAAALAFLQDKGAAGSAAGILILTVALAALVPIIFALGSMPWPKLALGIGAVAAMIILFAVAANALVGTELTLLALGAAIALFGAGVAGIGAGLFLFAAGIAALAAAAGLVRVAMMAMAKGLLAGIAAFLSGLGDISGDIIKGIDALLDIVFKVIKNRLPSMSEMLFEIIESLLDTLIEHVPTIAGKIFDFVIAIINTLATKVPDIIAAIANLISAIIGELANYNPPSLESIILGLLGITAVITILQALPLTAGLVAALQLAEFIAGMVIILTALGALSTIPGVSDLMSGGVGILATIGEGLGQFVGSIISGIGVGLSAGLVAIGMNLSLFATSLIPFLAIMSSIDESVFTGIKNIAGAILALTAAELLDGLSNMLSFITGGSSFAEFGNELAAMGPGLEAFSNSVANVNISKVSEAAEAISILANAAKNIPNEGGFISKLTGDNAIDDWGNKLPALGKGVSAFAEAIGSAPLDNVGPAAEAIKTLAEAASNIPNEGGWLSQIVGDNSADVWGHQLPILGMGLGLFAVAVGSAPLDNVGPAAEAIKLLAEASQEIPNAGGLLAQLVGDNSIDEWGSKLPVLGAGISEFASNVSGITTADVLIPAITAIRMLAEVSKILGENNNWITSLFGGGDISLFSANLPTLGEAISKFSENVEGIQVFAVSSSVEAINALIGGLSAAGGIPDTNKLPDFGSTLEAFAPGFSAFGLAVSGMTFSNMSLAISAITSMASGLNGVVIPTGEGLIELGTQLESFGPSMAIFGNSLVGVEFGSAMSAISTAKSAATMLNSIGDVSLIAVINFKAAIAELATTDYQGMADAFRAGSVDVVGIITQMLTDSEVTIAGFTGKFKSAAENLMNNFKSGVESKKSAITSVISNMLTAARTSVASQSGSFYTAGANAAQGFVNGLNSKNSAIRTAAVNIANTAVNAIKNTMNIASPSKVMRQMGDYAVQGFVLGLTDDIDNVAKVGEELAKMTMLALSTALDLVESSDDLTPTITPVLDLSEIQNGITSMHSMFNGSPAYAMAASTGRISSPNSMPLNGLMGRLGRMNNNDVVQELSSLRSDVRALNENMAKLQVVMDTGALVGSIASPLDAKLGRMAAYRGRGN